MSAKGQLRIRILGDASGVKPAMDKATGAVAAGAAAMGAVFIAAVNKALNVGAAADKMAASLGLSATESKRLGGVAGKLYADAYGDSIETVSGAVESVISSIDGMRGASASAVQSMTAKALDLATAFELDVGRGAQVAGQMISTNLARDGGHAMDLLTASLQRVPKAVREDLLAAVDEYGPFMKGLGLTGEKAMGLLVGASQKGAFGIDKLGDSLKEFMIRATDMSTASKVGYDALGLSQEDMAGKFLAGGETARKAFDQIVTGLRGIKDPVKQSQAALALFGTPLEDLSVQEIPKFLAGLDSTKNNLGQVAGAADRMGDTLNSNAKTNITKFWRTLETGVVNFIGNRVLPTLSNLAGFLSDHVGPVFAGIGQVLNATVVPAFQWFSGVVTENQDTIGLLASFLGGAIAPLLAFKGAVKLTGLVFGGLKTVVTGTKIAFGLLNAVWKASPIGRIIWLVGGLVGAVMWLWNKSEGFRKVATAVWHAIETAVHAVGDAIGWVIDRFKDAVDWARTLARKASEVKVPQAGGSAPGNPGFIGFLGGLFRAAGGPVEMGQPYIVGEQGPELFFPGQSGHILSNVDSAALMDQADQEARASLSMLAGTVPAAPAGTVINQTFNFPNYVGSRTELVNEIREAVRTTGRGSAQRFLGTRT